MKTIAHPTVAVLLTMLLTMLLILVHMNMLQSTGLARGKSISVVSINLLYFIWPQLSQPFQVGKPQDLITTVRQV